MEFRVNNRSVDSLMLWRTVEVCIDDQWYKIMSSGAYVAASNSQSPHNISIQVDITSVMITGKYAAFHALQHFMQNVKKKLGT